MDAPKLTESPKATTVHNQPGSTQPVSSNTTSEQPNVEKESNNNTQRLTESPKTTTVNNTLGSTQVEPTPVSTNVTTNNTSDVISPEKLKQNMNWIIAVFMIIHQFILKQQSQITTLQLNQL